MLRGKSMDHEQFMKVALEEAQRAANGGNVGVGSVVVRDGDMVARGRNLVPVTHDPTAHAETVALRNASEILGTDDMTGYSLYTTFEPCPMCCGALMNANISSVILGGRPDADQTRWGGYTMERLLEMCGWSGRMEVVTGVLFEECMVIRQP
jgi:tRNA(adenine34) deaminase